MSKSTYTGQPPPDTQLDPRIIPFFEAFYATSDNPSDSSHDDYADAMTSDGVLIMGTKKSEGREQIYALRKGLWSGPVKTRKHHLHRIYPFGSTKDANDFMLHGNVDYVLHNGKEVKVDWAAHAQFADVDGKLRMRFYQVYLDSAPVAQAASA